MVKQKLEQELGAGLAMAVVVAELMVVKRKRQEKIKKS